MEKKKRLVVGVTGASGAPLAVALLKALYRFPEWETHVVVSEAGARLLREEAGMTPEDVGRLAGVVYDNADVGAAIASGTFRAEGMIVAPCSMKTLAGIHSGYADSLLLRAADVTLKERRPLVLAARETPLNRIHLRNMLELAEMGAVIMPPVLTFYHGPRNVEELVTHMVGKMLGVFGLVPAGFRPWCEE